MPDEPAPQPGQRQFRGRDWIVPPPKPRADDAAATAALPPPVPGAPFADAPAAGVRPSGPPSRRPTDRDLLFQRYAELRQKLADRPHDEALLAEAAEVAEELSLTIEAMELWRECLRINPMHPSATHKLSGLDRRAAATGETGTQRGPAYKPREQPPEAPPFWTDFGALLAYPFRGRGLGVFVGASLFFAVGEVLATFNVFFGWFVMLCLLGYLAAWQFDVVSRTAAGKDDPPEFPEVVSIIDSCVLPFFGFVGCVLFAFAPMIVIAVLTIQRTLSPAVGGVAMLLALVPCAFAFPMTLTVRALTQSVGEAMNPVRVYGSIGRVLPDYILGFLSLAALWFGWAVVRVGVLFVIGVTFGLPTADAVLNLDYVRIVGWLLYTGAVWPLLLYVWCVQGHLLGCVYRQSYKRLAWFVPPGAETARAKRLSAAVALAGLGGALLLLGGGWLTYRMWPGDRANAVLSGGASPIAPGAELTYFWENTDGPAGLVTYRFEAAGDGRLGVSALYRQTGDFGVTASQSPVGVVDAHNGAVVRADGEESGIHLAERVGRHTRFYGPRRGSTNSTYLNDWMVRGELRFKDAWTAWRVVDPDTSTELYYDKATGVLVGRKFSGVGFTVTEWLTEAKGVNGISRCPPPNRTFDPAEPDEAPDPFDGVMTPQPFGMPPRDMNDRR